MNSTPGGDWGSTCAKAKGKREEGREEKRWRKREDRSLKTDSVAGSGRL